MKTQIEHLKVCTRDGLIWIEQQYLPGEDNGIAVHPSQVPTLVQWLQANAAALTAKDT